jgi:hypothetical protein
MLVPEAPVASILGGTDAGFGLRDGQVLSEAALILAIADRLEAKFIFEFGPGTSPRAASLAEELDGEAIVTDQTATGHPDGDRARAARMLSPEAIARTEVLRHVDTYHGPGARLAYAAWINTCDLVIVDAARDQDLVRCDSLTAIQLAKSGGVILWCHYGSVPGVTACLNNLQQSIQSLRSMRHIAGTNLCIWRRDGTAGP